MIMDYSNKPHIFSILCRREVSLKSGGVGGVRGPSVKSTIYVLIVRYSPIKTQMSCPIGKKARH